MSNWIWRSLAVKYPMLKHVYDLIRPAHGAEVVKVTEDPIVRRFLGDNLGKVLEVGYGMGPYIGWISQNAQFYCGIDLGGGAPLEAYLAAKNGVLSLSFVAGLAQTLPFSAEKFDAVLCTQVLEHIADDLRALREIARVLRPGGRAIIAVPVPPPPVSVELDTEERGGHVRHGYTLEELNSKLMQAGLMTRQSSFCVKKFSRFALRMLSFSQRSLGRGFPAFVLIAVAWCDRLFGDSPSHNPYGLVVEACKTQGGRVQDVSG